MGCTELSMMKTRSQVKELRIHFQGYKNWIRDDFEVALNVHIILTY